MKTEREWIETFNSQDGADVNPCNIKLVEIRAIQADALRRACEIVSQQDQIIDPRPTAKKIIGLIEAEASQLETK